MIQTYLTVSCVCVSVHMCVHVCLCAHMRVCVCVRERERERLVRRVAFFRVSWTPLCLHIWQQGRLC